MNPNINTPGIMAKSQHTRFLQYLAREVKFEKKLITNKTKIDTLIERGSSLIIELVTDQYAINKIQKEIDQIRKGWTVPYGDPNHPKVIRYNTLKEKLFHVLPKKEYYLGQGTTVYKIGKFGFDYAKEQIAKKVATI